MTNVWKVVRNVNIGNIAVFVVKAFAMISKGGWRMKIEELTLDDKIEISKLLAEYESIMNHLPLIEEEYFRRRDLINKYQKSIGKYLIAL